MASTSKEPIYLDQTDRILEQLWDLVDSVRFQRGATAAAVVAQLAFNAAQSGHRDIADLVRIDRTFADAFIHTIGAS